MSTRIIHRPARTSPSTPRASDWYLERPPAMPEGESGVRSLLMLVPLLGAGGSMTVMMLFRGSPLAAVGALMMLVTILASGVLVLSQRGKTTRLRQQQRERYLDYLERQRIELADDERALVDQARLSDPETSALLSLARSPERLWERRRDDEDYLQVRLGTGTTVVRAFSRTGEENALQPPDEFMVAELTHVERRFSAAQNMPIRVDLTTTGNISVVGDGAFTDQVTRVLLAQVCTLSSPEDVNLALIAPPERLDLWQWLCWLPHLADQNRTSATGPVRRIIRTVAEFMQLVEPELRQRHSAAAELRRHQRGARTTTRFPRLIAVVDSLHAHAPEVPIGDREVDARALGVSVLYLLSSRLHEPDNVAVRISQDTEPGVAMIESYPRRDVAPHRERVRLDDLTAQQAESLARVLAGLRLSPDSLEHDIGQQTLAATELIGIDNVEHIDLDHAWRPRAKPAFLRVPIGTDEHGEPVMVDLKEAAHFGMGPHGLCVGATGSGKSELLRTLLLGLLATHGPADLNLVLVDYKGGATFAPFADAPQVSGVITNLSDDATLVDRVYASLEGEVQRRQQALKDAGNLPDISAYRRLRVDRMNAGEELAALPHLLVIIDEFGELLTARPDFIDLFLSIGRIGRSIGVHLLLSSQRIEGGKLRGLDTYLSYRIGLRTLSESESRTVLETPDAFSLPPLPGYGYLKVDTTTYTRFRAGYVSGPLAAATAEDWGAEEAVIVPVPRYAHEAMPEAEPAPSSRRPQRPRPDSAAVDDGATGPTVLDVVIRQLATRPRVTSPVWLPPMPDVLTLDQLAGMPVATDRGLRSRRSGHLVLPIGLLDDPARQRQSTWELDLTQAGGHVLIVGAPSSGRTTALRTIAAAIALTHHPSEAIIHAVDLLGSNLAPLAGLPHVSGVAVRMDVEVVRRTLEEVNAYLVEREELFRRYGITDIGAARRLAEAGTTGFADLMLADVVLLIDGYGQLAEEFAEVADKVTDLVRRGGAYGIHLVATVSRWNEVRLNQQTFFGTRIELRLGDPQESSVGSALAKTLTSDRPGRCLLASELFAHLALPRIDGERRKATAGAGFTDLITQIAASTEDRAPRVRLLPEVVRPHALTRPEKPGAIALGLDESDLSTVTMEFDHRDPHVVILGDSGTGRTSVLRHVAESLMERYTSDEIVFAVIDPRRTLQGMIPEEYIGGYASTPDLAQQLAAAIQPELRKRMPSAPGASTDTVHLPRIVLLVDDYEVVTAGSMAPLQSLTSYIPMGRELNFTVVLARRTAGAARGIYEATFMAVRDSGATGLMLSGDRSEGQLFGTVRPRRLPPGRALLVRTGEMVRTVQVAFRPGTARNEGIFLSRRSTSPQSAAAPETAALDPSESMPG
ncbi:MAG: type VII secretion protein EccCa [Actinomycetota bacterium]